MCLLVSSLSSMKRPAPLRCCRRGFIRCRYYWLNSPFLSLTIDGDLKLKFHSLLWGVGVVSETVLKFLELSIL